MIEKDDGNKWYDILMRDFTLGWKEMTKSIFLIPTLIVIYKIWNLEAVIVGLYFIQLIWLLLKDKFKKKHNYKKLKGTYEKFGRERNL